MASERKVLFSMLTSETRERLVACVGRRESPTPLLETREGFGAAIAPGLALIILGLGLAAYHAIIGFGSSLLSSASTACIVIGFALAAAGVFAIGARRRVVRSTGLPVGRYLFASGLVDATDERVMIRPSSTLAEARARGARLDLRFASGATEHFDAEDASEASRIAKVLLAARERSRREADASEALEGDDAREVDPLAELFSPPDPRAEPSRALDAVAARDRYRLAAILFIGLALGVPVSLLRDRASDDAMFRQACAEGTKAAYDRYLERGSRHAAEVRETRLPNAERAVVRAARDIAYDAFADQAATDDPRLLPFMKKLLTWLERHGTTRVAVRFRAPTTYSLQLIDAILANDKLSHEGPVAKVSPHFDAEHAVPREATIVRSLAASFGAVFPSSIVSVEAGAPLDDDAKASDSEEPTIEVAYKVGFTGDVYGEEKGDRKFVGIVVAFVVTMRIPGEADAFDVELKVEPPDSFDVQEDDSGDGGPPTEGRVYDTMAARAFDRLDVELRKRLFRAGTPGFTAGARP